MSIADIRDLLPDFSSFVYRFIQEPGTGVLFGPAFFTIIWSIWKFKVYDRSHKNRTAPTSDRAIKREENKRLNEMRLAEPYVAIATHIFALVMGGSLSLLINCNRAYNAAPSDWKIAYLWLVGVLFIYFVGGGLFFNFFIPDDVITRYRNVLEQKRAIPLVPQAAYGMLFTWYRWGFGLLALITSGIYGLHEASRQL